MMETPDNSKWRRDDRDDAGGTRNPSRRGSLNISLIAFIVVVALAVVFFFQNSKKTEVTFLFFDAHTPVRSAIAVSVLVGVLLDRLISFWWRRRRGSR